MNGLEVLGKSIAGSEQQAEKLVRRALEVLGLRAVHESWGLCIETADGECRDVFFDGMPAFSTSWSSILGKLVAVSEFGLETKEDRLSPEWPSSGKGGKRSVDIKWTSNPLFGCRSREEVEMKLDLLGKGGQS